MAADCVISFIRCVAGLLRPEAGTLSVLGQTPRAAVNSGRELADPLVLRDLGILIAFGLLMAIGAIASIRREVA